jgi:hypothetical protein
MTEAQLVRAAYLEHVKTLITVYFASNPEAVPEPAEAFRTRLIRARAVRDNAIAALNTKEK